MTPSMVLEKAAELIETWPYDDPAPCVMVAILSVADPERARPAWEALKRDLNMNHKAVWAWSDRGPSTAIVTRLRKIGRTLRRREAA